ncbi:MAG: hypothetical protein FJ271_14630 [Planctomycetes bacterium]|nr:hypothetical protein [Planctomycetota bacterium]
MAAEVVLKTLEHVWNVLSQLPVRKALMGGLAVAFWKHLRLTQDVDILIAVDDSALADLVARLQAADMRGKRSSPVLHFGPQKIIQVLYQPPGSFLDIQVDLLVAPDDYARNALTRAQPAVLPGVAEPIDVLTCEDLVIHKLIAGRILDQADAAALLRINSKDLDFAYLKDWIDRLGLRKEWEDVVGEAFPSERPPATQWGG